MQQIRINITLKKWGNNSTQATIMMMNCVTSNFCLFFIVVFYTAFSECNI